MKRIFEALSALVLFFVSCSTTPSFPPQPWTDTLLPSGIRIFVRPSAREDLVRRFGEPGTYLNPLLDYPAVLSGQKILALDVRIESPEHRVELVTWKTSILFDDARPGFLSPAEARALSAQELRDAWMPYIEGTSKVGEADQRAKEALPGNLKAAPGSPVSGYLVFLHTFPKSGSATLLLTLRASNGDEGTVKVRIEIPDPERSNTPPGIFSQPEDGST